MKIFTYNPANWILVVLWMGLIFFLSSIPTLPGAGYNFLDFITKKSAHMFVYAVLFWLLSRNLKKKNTTGYLLIFFICFLYAVSDEFHQSFVPGRTPNVMDVGFDSVGMTLTYMKLQNII